MLLSVSMFVGPALIFIDAKHLFMELDGLVEPAGIGVNTCEVVAGRQRVQVVGAERAIHERDGLFEERNRIVRPAGVIVGVGQAGHGDQGVGVLEPQLGLEERASALELRDLAVDLTEIGIAQADRITDARLDLGLIGKTCRR